MLIVQVKRLYYREKLSAAEVGQKLGKTVWQVIKFMKKNNLPRRSQAETHHFQFEKQPLSYKKKIKLSFRETKLHLAGLMLYWGEGVKALPWVVDFVNSDKKMILIFLSMLRKVYQVKESKLRILLYCYANQNPKELIYFWSKLLKIPKKQFIKPYIRQDFKPEKINKMPHGVIHIRYCDKKLFSQIMREIDIIANRYSGWGSEAVKHIAL